MDNHFEDDKKKSTQELYRIAIIKKIFDDIAEIVNSYHGVPVTTIIESVSLVTLTIFHELQFREEDMNLYCESLQKVYKDMKQENDKK